ncbi:MAG: hypothetical protein ACRC9L_06100 [Brevinema sp.]
MSEYRWKGMTKIPYEQVLESIKKGKVDFALWLYPDDTEAYIESDEVTQEMIEEHHHAGGEFGIEKE